MSVRSGTENRSHGHGAVSIALAAVLLASAMAAPPSAAQEGSATDPAYRAPRTPDGQPDISGIWTNETLTPLERPARLGDKAFYTEAEAAEMGQSGRTSYDRDGAPGNRRTVAGQFDSGYNRFWSDVRDTVVYTRRTSMIADPAGGGGASGVARGAPD